MGASSGIVSCAISINGGWYPPIIEAGRKDWLLSCLVLGVGDFRISSVPVCCGSGLAVS
jgi:hypothetical protein